MTSLPLDNPLNELRRRLRQQRRELSPSEQQTHALQALAQVKKLFAGSEFQQPQKIAVFFTQDGELASECLIEWLWQETKHRLYLPVLHQQAQQPMSFAHYTPQTKLLKNRFDIPEPADSTSIAAEQLDWVFTPLVAYDGNGNRMGMGGGFYDRTFAFKQHQAADAKPHLIGWAHSLQKVEQLPTQPWDIPLYSLVNERQIECFNKLNRLN